MLNPIVAQTQDSVRELVAASRALAQDLEVSRRLAAELGRERDALRNQVEALALQAQAAAERARAAEGSLRCLIEEQRRTTAERDDLAAQLDDSVGALDEIRSRLFDLPGCAAALG